MNFFVAQEITVAAACRGTAACRELATQTNGLTLMLREAERLRGRRDIDPRMDPDRDEIGRLRTSLETSRKSGSCAPSAPS